MLVVIVSGIKTQTWFLVGIGAVNMVYTVLIAGKSLSSSAFAIHPTPRDFILKNNGMGILKEVEQRYPGIGISCSPHFPWGSKRMLIQLNIGGSKGRRGKRHMHSGRV